MSSGLRLRRPVFLPPDSAVLSVFAASLFAPSFFPSSVFLLPARISHCPCFSLPVSPSVRVSLCPCLPLPVFLSARVSLCPCFSLPVSPSARVSLSPHLASFVGPSSFVCIPSGFSSVISCFSVHRPSPAACCPSLVAPSIVQRLPLVVRRPLSIPCRPLSIPCRPLSIPCRPLPVTCRPLFIACCVARTPSPLSVPRRPSRRASFRCRSVRITAFVSAESRPACLRELLAVSFRSGFRRSVFPQKCVRPPYLGRRAVSDKITPCILLSGAIFPARPAILLTIWQRLPFGTTFVQIQGVTGAPDPQGGRIPAARKENGKNINN